MSELSKRIATSILLLIILYLSFLDVRILYSLILIVNFIVLYELIKIFGKIFKIKNLFYFLSILLGLIYMCYFTLIIFLFVSQSFDLNKFKILFLLSICIATDMGGFIFGKIIGGKKITKISPNKTYSGALGSFILAIIFGYIFYYYQKDIIFSDINIFLLIIIISLVSQIGDLIISALKRKAKIKDTGIFLPGHGGILDRIDGIIIALPIGILII